MITITAMMLSTIIKKPMIAKKFFVRAGDARARASCRRPISLPDEGGALCYLLLWACGTHGLCPCLVPCPAPSRLRENRVLLASLGACPALPDTVPRSSV